MGWQGLRCCLWVGGGGGGSEGGSVSRGLGGVSFFIDVVRGFGVIFLQFSSLVLIFEMLSCWLGLNCVQSLSPPDYSPLVPGNVIRG